MSSDSSPRIVREPAKKRQVSPRHPSTDCALNRGTLPKSLPDRRSSRPKSGVFFGGFAWHEWFLRAFPLLSFFSSKKRRNSYSERVPKKWGFGFPGASARPPVFFSFASSYS